jgi:hypothetical protein
VDSHICLGVLLPKNVRLQKLPLSSILTFSFQVLRHAYTQPFRGQNATQFLNYLLETEASVRGGEVVYAKSVSIVQSSGTGKSRMLTEARFFYLMFYTIYH